MTDRELLELAAKAAGVQFAAGKYDFQFGLDAYAPLCRWWNPIADDGDALRLAVGLEIEVHHAADVDGDGEMAAYASTHGHPWFVELHREDPYAATRRAIVLAAAEICRSMN